jgi:hypothetical protein
MSMPIKLLEIPENEQTPLVRSLLRLIEELVEKIYQQDHLGGELSETKVYCFPYYMRWFSHL